MRSYHLLPFSKYFALTKGSRSTDHISYAGGKKELIRKPSGRVDTRKARGQK